MTSSWFFLSTLNYDARSTTHQIYRKLVLLAQVVVRDFLSNDVPATLKCLLDVCLAGDHRISFGMYSPSWRWQTHASLKRWYLPYFAALPCARTSYPTIKPPPLFKMLFRRTGYSHLIHFFLFSFFETLQNSLSRYLTNLMHKSCFTISFISCLYTFRAHVLIIRRSKLHYTASGIITPICVMIPEAV